MSSARGSLDVPLQITWSNTYPPVPAMIPAVRSQPSRDDERTVIRLNRLREFGILTQRLVEGR